MKQTYLLRDGTAVTKDEIEEAFNAGLAVLCHGRGEGKTTTGLMLDGNHYDTRGQCFSVWEEAWTRTPKDINECWSAVGAKVGRPSEMAGGKKVNTYLDAESIAIATRLGNGNVSEGIRKALKASNPLP